MFVVILGAYLFGFAYFICYEIYESKLTQSKICKEESKYDLSSFILNTSLSIWQQRRNIISASNSTPIDLEFIKYNSYIFIGGYGRSGTTLMRAILDMLPSLQCGPETKIVQKLLNFVTKQFVNKEDQNSLYSKGLLEKAASLFIC